VVENLIMGSILSIDWGSVESKAFLLDKADGSYRLLAKGRAPTWGLTSEENPLVGFREAITRLEQAVGRKILGEQGYPLLPEREMEGVDALTISVSLAPPLRVMLVGLSEELSLSVAREALHSYYAQEVGSFSFLGVPDKSRRLEHLIKTFLSCKPDVVLMVGGTEGGAMEPLIEMANMLALAYSLWTDTERPPVVFAGNSAARSQVAEILGSRTEVRVTDNVLPSPEEENWGSVFAELENLYQQLKMSKIYGLGPLRSLLSVPMIPSASSFAIITRYLAHMYGLEKGVVGVDLGGSNTTVVAATKEHFSITVRDELGFNKALYFVEEDHLENIMRWLPFEVESGKVAEIIMERHLRPGTVPVSKEELLIEEAIAREILREALLLARKQWRAFLPSPHHGVMPPVDLITATGGILGSIPQEGEIALILLDALQPAGVVNLAVDKLGLSVALGTLAPLNTAAAIQVLEMDTFTRLGVVVAPIGVAPEGELALRMKVSFDDGRSLEVDVKAGALEVIPLPPKRKAVLEIKPSGYFDLGIGAKGKGAKVEVQGGSLGIIIDARGRPLRLPPSPRDRMEKIQKWLWEIG